MSGSIRIVDMPDLGAVNDISSVVGERAGSGRFGAAALRNYVYAYPQMQHCIIAPSAPTIPNGILPGDRGPLFVQWNPSSTVAGQAAGAQIWVGGNPTATPGAGDTIGLSVMVTNEMGRSQIWGGDISVLQTADQPDGDLRCLELDICNAKGFNPDPWSSGLAPYRKNGIEFTTHAAAAYQATSAFMTWANGGAGTNWWYIGGAFGRVAHTGVLFQKLTGDTVEAFQFAAISDVSNSARVLNVEGSHAILFDMTRAAVIGTWIKGMNTANTEMAIENQADWDVDIRIGAGTSAPKNAGITLRDRTVDQWHIYKGIDNNFRLTNLVAGADAIEIDVSNNLVNCSGGLMTSFGATWLGGTVVPTHIAPIGSLFSRINGTVGATLYVSRGGGTWAAVAGV